MQYTKEAKSFDEQAEILLNRGLIGDIDEITSFLSRVDYYSFSGYLYSFRDFENDNFLSGTKFEKIKNIYQFDSKLRKLTFSYIEKIEIGVLRSQFVEKYTLEFGPFGYLNPLNYRLDDLNDFDYFVDKIKNSVKNSQEQFVKLYYSKYDEENLPLWMVSNLVSMNVLSRMLEASPSRICKLISEEYKLNFNVLVSFLHSLTYIRNICAHHYYLWNRNISIKPTFPNKIENHPEFHMPEKISNNRYYAVLATLKYLMDFIEPNNTLVEEFDMLLREYPDVPIDKLGIPENWKLSKMFKK